MKQNILLYLSAFLCLAVSCKKDQSSERIAGLTLINALSGCPQIVADFTGKPPAESYSGRMVFDYGVYRPSNHLSIQSKEQPLALYKFPFIAQDKPLCQLILKPAEGDMSTLFLTGTLAQPDQLLVTAKTPYYSVKDSLLGLRFVNLSPGSGPVRVKVSGQGLNADISSSELTYKGITSYLPIPATSKVGDLLVEFFDQASGNLVSSFNLAQVGAVLTDNQWRYKSYTLALKGLPNAARPTDAQGLFLINDF